MPPARASPDTAWITQQARNVLMDLEDPGRRLRFVIHDRYTKYSRAFDSIFRGEGVEIVRTPIRAPNANSYAERRVGSVRRECLDRLMIFGRPPARARPPRLHPSLQPAASTPSARPATAGSRKRNRSHTYGDPSLATCQPARPPRRTDPRIRSRGVTIEFVHPTRAARSTSSRQTRPAVAPSARSDRRRHWPACTDSTSSAASSHEYELAPAA
jgi:transposase InsO family protein